MTCNGTRKYGQNGSILLVCNSGNPHMHSKMSVEHTRAGDPAPLFFCGKEPAPRYAWGLSRAIFGLVGRSGRRISVDVMHGRERRCSRVCTRVTRSRCALSSHFPKITV